MLIGRRPELPRSRSSKRSATRTPRRSTGIFRSDARRGNGGFRGNGGTHHRDNRVNRVLLVVLARSLRRAIRPLLNHEALRRMRIGQSPQSGRQQRCLPLAGSIPMRLTTLSSALSDGAKYLKSGAVTAVRLNRFPSYAIPSGKNSCCSRCL